MSHIVYRNGKVYVLGEMCPTCIFRGGNLMDLRSGRVKEMVEDATRDESTIVCHSTLYTGAEACCRGFYEKYPTGPLRLARLLGMVEEVGAPETDPLTAMRVHMERRRPH